MRMADDSNAFVQWRHAPQEKWQYCPLCRGNLVDHCWDGKMRRYCVACGFVYWERPLPAAAAVVLNPDDQERIILVRRRYPPEMGHWTLPGGGIEAGESALDAVMREVEEETGLVIAVDEQLGTWSTPIKETIITFYLAHADGGRLIAGTDAAEVAWFGLDAMPRLAFSTHREVLARYRNLFGHRGS